MGWGGGGGRGGLAALHQIYTCACAGVIHTYTFIHMFKRTYICMYVYVRLRAFMCFCINSPEGQMVLGFCIPQVGQHGLDAGF